MSPLDADGFDEATFSQLDLAAASLGGREFSRCTFDRCALVRSTWSDTRLEDCTFRGCDLTQASFAKLALRGVTFLDCKLMGIDFSSVSAVPDVRFERCVLRYVSFSKVSLRKQVVSGCDARESNWLDVDLTDADFSASQLGGAVFRGCTLTRADFRTAKGALLDPARNKVTKARISDDAAALLAAHFGFEVA